MTPCDQNSLGPPRHRADFPTTHWSVVAAAANSAVPGADEALEQLCRTYWHPVYSFVRRQGRGPDDALDLTQGFFARFLEKKHIKLADSDRGRLRSFLLVSLKNFLLNEWANEQAKKRGGRRRFLSLDEHREGETCFLAEPADPAMPPDLAFEKRWALILLDQVLSRLREESSATAGREHFDTLNALGVAVHRLRRRFGELLREAIARTVVGENEIDLELRHLIKVICS
jgi:RNA polymerase sigma-70 factor (ECF subfamily)